jgi:hypothetical protein
MRNRSLPPVFASLWCLGLGGCLSAALNHPLNDPGDWGREPAFVIGGTVHGANGALTLQNSNGTQLNVTNGSFRFETPMVTSAWYRVTVRGGTSTRTACRVSKGSGTVGTRRCGERVDHLRLRASGADFGKKSRFARLRAATGLLARRSPRSHWHRDSNNKRPEALPRSAGPQQKKYTGDFSK